MTLATGPAGHLRCAGMADEHARSGDAGVIHIDGVQVAPPMTEDQARGLLADGLLADDRDGLARCWRTLIDRWDSTAAGPALEATVAKQRVNGEWSLVETLRHLVMVTDAWVGAGVLGRDEMHPLGLPPHFMPPDPRFTIDADPDVDEVLTVRRERQELVADAIASAADLARPCHAHLSEFSVLGALQVVLLEEWAHHHFATRDLAALGVRPS